MQAMEDLIASNVDAFYQWLWRFVPGLVAGLVTAVTSWFLGRWIKRLIDRMARRLQGDEILWGYLGTALRYVVVVVGFTSALEYTGFPVDTLLATFGISGVIIGFGARASIANYFAGIMMLAARPFKQGDLIEFGPPPQIGRVTEVKMTYTGLVSLDNVRVVVPNLVMWRNKIVNFSSLQMRAIRIPIGVPYDVDVDWVEDLALDVLRQHDGVLNEPAPMFTVSDVTASDTKALLVAWSRADTMNIFGDVITRMRKAFETAGLAVTVPAKDIDLKREE